MTVWLTGLSASGKSTIACALERRLIRSGIGAYRLDGDNVRHGLNADLGFSAEDRTENIRRIAHVGQLMADACLVCITAFISPYRKDRYQARQLHEQVGLPFVEVYVDVPLEVAEQRDPKGLYAKARAGEIKQFTGIDAPYEAPENSELRIDNAHMGVDEAVQQIIDYLVDRNFIPHCK